MLNGVIKQCHCKPLHLTTTVHHVVACLCIIHTS